MVSEVGYYARLNKLECGRTDIRQPLFKVVRVPTFLENVNVVTLLKKSLKVNLDLKISLRSDSDKQEQVTPV